MPGNVSKAQLIQMIHSMPKGASYHGSQTAGDIFRLLRQEQKEDGIHLILQVLSPQERRIVALIADGNVEGQIAEKLQLSEEDTKNYMSHIFKKLEAWHTTDVKTLRSSAELSSTLTDKNTST